MDSFDAITHIAEDGTAFHSKGKPACRFHYKSFKNENMTTSEGRPMFDTKLMIEVWNPGKKDRPGWKEIKFIENSRGEKVPDPSHPEVKRFGAELRRFLENQDAPPIGVPLEQWPGITTEELAVCRFLEIRTVEELAGLKENQAVLQKMGPGAHGLCRRAETWLKVDEDKSHAQKLAADNEGLQKRIAALEALVAETTGKKK